MRRRTRRIREAILALALLFILWQFWAKVRILIWFSPPWWAIPLIVIGLIILLDLVLDRLFGSD